MNKKWILVISLTIFNKSTAMDVEAAALRAKAIEARRELMEARRKAQAILSRNEQLLQETENTYARLKMQTPPPGLEDKHNELINHSSFIMSKLKKAIESDKHLMATADARSMRGDIAIMRGDIARHYTESHCSGCHKGKSDSGDLRLKKCTGCNRVKYCSTECQRSDWKFHKRTCPRTQTKK